MTAVNKVAIAGCGVAGMAAAIALAKAGLHVDIFESKPELSALGSASPCRETHCVPSIK